MRQIVQRIVLYGTARHALGGHSLSQAPESPFQQHIDCSLATASVLWPHTRARSCVEVVLALYLRHMMLVRVPDLFPDKDDPADMGVWGAFGATSASMQWY